MEQLTANITITDRFGANPQLFLVCITRRTIHIKNNLYEVIVQKGYFGKKYSGVMESKDIMDVLASVCRKLKRLR